MLGPFIKNGAVAVEVGGSLLAGPCAIAEERFEVLQDLVKRFAAEIRKARGA